MLIGYKFNVYSNIFQIIKPLMGSGGNTEHFWAPGNKEKRDTAGTDSCWVRSNTEDHRKSVETSSGRFSAMKRRQNTRGRQKPISFCNLKSVSRWRACPTRANWWLRIKSPSQASAFIDCPVLFWLTCQETHLRVPFLFFFQVDQTCSFKDNWLSSRILEFLKIQFFEGKKD